MTKRHRIIILLPCGVLVVAALIFLSGPREPSYQGKTLSQWFENQPKDTGAREWWLPIDAVRAMGATALPPLVEWLQYEASPRRQQFDQVLDRIYGFFGLHTQSRASRQCGWAVEAFLYLGPQAEPAIPALVRLMNDYKRPVIARRAAWALGCVRTEKALPPLMAVLTNEHHHAHTTVIDVIGYLGTNAGPAIPTLLRYLEDPDPKKADEAAQSLGAISLQPALVVAALARHLEDRNMERRPSAVRALSRFGREAQPAVPALLRILNDTDWNLRELATNAIQAVAPEALTNASPK